MPVSRSGATGGTYLSTNPATVPPIVPNPVQHRLLFDRPILGQSVRSLGPHALAVPLLLGAALGKRAM